MKISFLSLSNFSRTELTLKNILTNLLLWTVLVLISLPFIFPKSSQARYRVIFDTDANNEIDDQHAIAYLLFNQDTFHVVGITTNKTFNGGTIENNTEEAERIVKLCDSWGDFPVISGATGSFDYLYSKINDSVFDGQEAVNFIIQKAHETTMGKLILLTVGKMTNIALALAKDSTIMPKVKIIFLGTQIPDSYGDYNKDNDKVAVSWTLGKNVEFWIVPGTVSCSALTVTKTQINSDMPGKGPFISPAIQGRDSAYYNNFGDYSVALFGNVPDSERCIFDVVPIATLKNPSWGQQNIVYGPKLSGGGVWTFNGGSRELIYFNGYDSNAIKADFWESMNNPSLNPVKINFDKNRTSLSVSKNGLTVSPNPFNPTISINFRLLKNGPVSVDILNTQGKLVKNLVYNNLRNGLHQKTWNPKKQPSGVYYVKARIDNKVYTRKINLIR